MGMFDSLYVNCPECGNIVEFQSKVGDCSLRSYDKENVPMNIAIDLAGAVALCECGKAVEISTTTCCIIDIL